MTFTVSSVNNYLSSPSFEGTIIHSEMAWGIKFEVRVNWLIKTSFIFPMLIDEAQKTDRE